MTFKERVVVVVWGIPAGSVMTYKEVAVAACSPKAYRAVGTILKTNYNPHVPCHRVIRSDGQLGSYNRGAELKKQLIAQES